MLEAVGTAGGKRYLEERDRLGIRVDGPTSRPRPFSAPTPICGCWSTCVRRQGFWDQWRSDAKEALAHQVCHFRRLPLRCSKRRCLMVSRLIFSLSSMMVWPRPK